MKKVYKAVLKKDWIELYSSFFDGQVFEKDFIELAERIESQNRIIEVTTTAGDYFEKIDNNYWLPDCCFLMIEKGE